MTNLTTTIETPKLKIASTITETKFINKEIELPYYFKIDTYLYKVVTDQHLVRVDTGKDWWGARVFPVKSYYSEINKGTPIQADEFDSALSQAIMYVDLINRNENPSNEVDDNVQIDEMLERRAS